MNPLTKTRPAMRLFCLGTALVLAAQIPAIGQEPTEPLAFLRRDPVLPRDLAIGLGNDDTLLLNRNLPVRLFRMPTALPVSPLGLDDDPDPASDDPSAATSDASSASRVLVSMGNDNPFFDFRRPGDPGGVGYLKLHTQYLLFDTPNSGICLGLQAVTPAGLDADGVSQGPTVLSPNFACYYDLGGGTALHGFFGKSLRAGTGWSDGLERDARYGVALQSPVPGLARQSNPPPVFLFVEALGRNRFDTDVNGGHTSTNLDLVPGVQWRLGDKWLLSGGVLMPLNTPRADNRSWQISCSWQF
jgi:hypothetical protein